MSNTLTFWIPIFPVIHSRVLLSLLLNYIFIRTMLFGHHRLLLFLLSLTVQSVCHFHICELLKSHGGQIEERLEDLLLILIFNLHPVIYIVMLNNNTLNILR